MSQTNIAKIGTIKDLGLFKDLRAASNPDFRKYNLIYGFNGSGKTTLSRIFASLGLGARNGNLPEEGEFDVHLSDGTVASSGGDLSVLRGRVLVFNADFIDESFQWKKGEARPVFYIGKEQAELAEQLAKAIEALGKAEPEMRALQEQATAAERAFAAYKRNLARQIAEQLGLGRKYDATHLILPHNHGHLLKRPVIARTLLDFCNPAWSGAADDCNRPRCNRTPVTWR